ncbi:MAG: PEGA domain-containing protein [Patescibacteria group bacterium]|nr:PEGA domain-containing protein [Patescibacteria group bacterium]
MQTPPFHRRILPWIFIIVFLVAAPALVFYTAGYRWNPKKDKVERQGTLILDSIPNNARISLNGNPLSKTTPLTLQNVSPGRYVIRFDKDGYHPWQKQLDVQSEYVTFANDIRLWKQAEPQLTNLGAATLLEASPDQRYIAFINTSGTNSTLKIWDAERNQIRSTVISTEAEKSRPNIDLSATLEMTDVRILWAENSRSFVIENLLPNESWRVDVDNLEIEHLSQEKENDNLTILHTPGTEDLVLFTKQDPDRWIVLPPGDWTFYNEIQSGVILRSGSDWISLDPKSDSPTIHKAQGDALRLFGRSGQGRYLLKKDGEIWIWDPTEQPELILRDSKPLSEVTWYSSGKDVILATEQSVSMLNLDPRDGRIRTELANFDRVYDIALINKKIYIAGEKDAQNGIWSLEIE